MRPHLLLLLALLAAPLARASVIVITPTGTNGAALLQSALDTAQDGDVIVLKPGDYVGTGLPALHLAARGVSIVADAGPAPLPLRALNVDSLAEGACVVLRGLRFASPQDGSSYPHQDGSLDIKGDTVAAVVWVEDCEVIGTQDVPGSQFGLDGLILQGGPPGPGTSVVGVRSVFTGAMSDGPLDGAGGDAAYVPSGRLSLFECSLTGGEGDDANFPELGPADGGNGLYMLGLELYASATQFVGGAEGLNSPQATVSGSGIQLLLAASDGWLRDCTAVAGAVQGPIGTQGAAIVNPAQDIVKYAATPRSLALPALCREHAAVTLSAHGLTGDLVGLMLAPSVRWYASLNSRQGPPLVDLAQLTGPMVVGAISAADGSLAVPFTVPQLPPGLDAVRFYAQGIFAGSDGVTLGSGSAACWVEAGV